MKKYLLALGLFSALPLTQSQAQESALYRNPDAKLQAGLMRYKLGAYGQAQLDFQAYLDSEQAQGQNRDLAQLYLGLSLLRQGDMEGEKILNYFIRQHDPDALAMKARLETGRFYYAQKKYDQAIAYLQGVDMLDLPNEEIAETRFQLGYAYFTKNQKAKAKPLFRDVRSVQKSKYYHAANYYYGCLSFEDKNYREALEAFDVAEKSARYAKITPVYRCQIHFVQKEYNELIGYAQPLIDKKTPIDDRPTVALLLGQAYFEQKAYQQALAPLTEYYQGNQKISQEILYQLAYTQYKNKKYAEALQTFNQLNVLESALGQNALYNMADCYLKTENKTAARLAFQRAAQMNFDKETMEEARFQYAKLSYELGFDNDAINALQMVASTSPNYRQSQDLLSDIFLNTRDYDKALQTLRGIPNKTPQLKETYQKVAYFRSAQLYREDKLPRAMALLDTALNAYVHAETRALCFFWLGEGSYKQLAYDKAISYHHQFQALCSDKKLLQVLPDNSSPGTSAYTLGYAFLKQDKHLEAARYFTQTISYIESNNKKIRDLHVTNLVYPDALLRAGDCYLYLNRNASDRRTAKQYYATVVKNKYPNEDYALYQQSLIANLDGQYSEQIRLIDELLKENPQSTHADDALFSKGTVYLNNGQAAEAQTTYTRLIKEYPNSEWKNRARMRLAIALVAENRVPEAVDYYKAVLIDNPSPEEARDALEGVREIYVESGKSDEYYNFVSNLGYKVDEAERDSTMFRTAQRSYEQRNLEASVQHFNAYLQRYPNGLNSLKAHFLRGEAYFDLKKFDQALPDYAFVADKGNSSDAETANYRAAIISYYHSKNYTEAYRYYLRLETLASTEQMRFEARLFLLRSAFFAGNYTALPDPGKRFLEEPRASNAEKAEIHYYLGKAYQQGKQNALAKAQYQKTVELGGDDVRAAEARYQIARMFYEERDLDKSLDLCFKTNKEIPNHMYWLVKSFVLMADIYAEKGNLFQAKATLESILNNYNEDQELVSEVRRKFESVKQREAQKSKLD